MATDSQILAPSAVSGDQPDPRRWLTLVILLLAAFMNLLDVSIVNIAIPSIQRDLHASYADVQWALAGYTLAYALLLITGGRLGDTFGRKRLFLIGVVGFTIMSALCGAATGPGMLIACRVVQGAMGAIMVPEVLAVIQVIFPPAERIKALAGFGITAGLGTVSGPLLGGLLIQHNLLGLTWRPIFLINVPVGIIAVAASAVLVRESRAPRPPKLDPVGVALISAALLLLLYPLVQGRQLGWPTWTFVSMAVSAPVFAVFVIYERAKSRRDGSPLVELSLFRERAFSVGMAVAVTFFLSGAAARLAPRFGRGVTMAGALIIAAGMAAMIGIVHHYGVSVTTWDLAPGLVAAGLGLGAVIAPLADIVLAQVPGQHAGSASGVFNTGLQVGNSIGIAVIGVIFFGMLGSQSATAASAVTPQLRAGLVAAGLPAAGTGRVVDQFGVCLHDRLVAADPTVLPASCKPSGATAALPAAVHRELAAAGGAAVRLDFAGSLVRTLWFQVGVFGLSGLLMLAWPSGVGRRRAAAGGDTVDVGEAGVGRDVAAGEPAVIGGSHANAQLPSTQHRPLTGGS